MNRLIFSFITLLLFVSFIALSSANGLVLNTSSFTVNKTVGVSAPIQLVLTNSDSKTFYNISFENNSIIYASMIQALTSGQTATYTALINSDVNAVTSLHIKGFYESTIGIQNATYNVTVTSFDSTPCDLTLIRGDKIVFKNNLSNQISLRNYDTNQVVTFIESNQTYLMNFQTPQTFNYYFSISGFQFPQVCHVAVLSDTGLVNDPKLDAVLNISILANYPATGVSSTVLVNNYTVEFSSSQEGVMTVTNTGANKAYGIHLSGDWFSFNYNDFNLDTGQSKGLIYTINPIITSVNQTNKTYTKSFEIKGNFPTISQNFTVNIPFANFDENSSFNAANLIDIICVKYPELCNKTATVVYKYVNASDQQVNYSLSREQVNDIWMYLFSLKDEIQNKNNYDKVNKDDTDTKLMSVNATVENISIKLDSIIQNQDDSTNGIMVFLSTLAIIFIIGALVLLIYYYRHKRETDYIQNT